MNVYFGSNFWDDRKYEKPLREVLVYTDFRWEELSGMVPAVYICEEGAVVDVCIRIPVEKAEAFLEKWNQERRLSSDMTDEDYEEMERDNPFSLSFRMNMTVNGEKLSETSGCSTGWHPLQTESENIEREAEVLMEEYGCDRSSAWLFSRWCGRFSKKKTEIPESIEMTLDFQPWEVPFTAAYFETEEGCKEQEIEIKNPRTGELYRILLHGCEAGEVREEQLPQSMTRWPFRYQMLSYSILPEPSHARFQIVDCARSDQPREIHGEEDKTCCAVSVIGGEDGPTAVFFAGKSKERKKRAAMSALHFEKVSRVRWRAVFYEKVRKDLRVLVTGGKKERL